MLCKQREKTRLKKRIIIGGTTKRRIQGIGVVSKYTKIVQKNKLLKKMFLL